MQCDVRDGVIYISNKFKYFKTEVRYATAVKTNLYNFRCSFKHIYSFHIPFKQDLQTNVDLNFIFKILGCRLTHVKTARHSYDDDIKYSPKHRPKRHFSAQVINLYIPNQKAFLCQRVIRGCLQRDKLSRSPGQLTRPALIPTYIMQWLHVPLSMTTLFYKQWNCQVHCFLLIQLGSLQTDFYKIII